MTTVDITLIRGDSKILPLQLLDEAGDPVVLTGPHVLKATFKEDIEDPNEAAIILKRNYDASEIETTDPALGRIVLKLRKADTYNKDLGCYPWDLELTRAGDDITGGDVGTVTVVNGSGTLTGIGTAFTKFHIGDMLQLISGDAANNKPITVTKIVSATSIQTDYTGWTGAAGLVIDGAWEGDVKTPAGGKLTLTADVTR